MQKLAYIHSSKRGRQIRNNDSKKLWMNQSNFCKSKKGKKGKICLFMRCYIVSTMIQHKKINFCKVLLC